MQVLGVKPDAKFYSRLGSVYVGLTDYAMAVEAFQTALVTQPTDLTLLGKLKSAKR